MDEALGKRSKRIDVFSVPDHHRDGERVFLVPQLCQAVIRERLHEFVHRVSKGMIEAYLQWVRQSCRTVGYPRKRGSVYVPGESSRPYRHLER